MLRLRAPLLFVFGVSGANSDLFVLFANICARLSTSCGATGFKAVEFRICRAISSIPKHFHLLLRHSDRPRPQTIQVLLTRYLRLTVRWFVNVLRQLSTARFSEAIVASRNAFRPHPILRYGRGFLYGLLQWISCRRIGLIGSDLQNACVRRRRPAAQPIDRSARSARLCAPWVP